MIEPYIIVIAIRLLIPLLILKNPFWGLILAMLLDLIDLELINFLGNTSDNFSIDYSLYQRQDKFLDLYYLGLVLLVMNGAERLVKQAAWFLYVYRFLGVILFEVSQIRWLLAVFPNLFELFAFYYLLRLKFNAQFKIKNLQTLIITLALLLIPQLFRELSIHVWELKFWGYVKQNWLGW